MAKKQIKLGYEIPSGEEVCIPLAHTVITGLTAESGKTTALVGMMKRSGLKCLIIKTKIGEHAISEGSLIPPYYKEDFDWEYASELLESSRKEKLKFERSWIIRYSKGATSLEGFKKNIDDALSTGKLRELDKSVLISLQAYLEKIIPELKYAPLSNSLNIQEGINIMDLERFNEATQMLIIRSVLVEVLNNHKGVIVVLPEAWRVIPEDLATPVKRPAEAFVRQGATNGNYLFSDSMPNYEVILAKINGKIKPLTFEELWNFEGDTETRDYHDIKILKDMIEVMDSDGKRFKWHKITKVFRHPYEGEILSINTLDGVVDVSPNHPLLKNVKVNQITEAKNLKVGDILQSRRIEKKWRIHKNDGLFVGNEDLAWLLGFYCAEGWVHSGHVCFSNKNKVLLDKSKKIIEENLHHSASFTTPRKEVYTLDLNSPQLVGYFKNQCYNSSHIFDSDSKQVPINILNAPTKIKKAFLEGYLEGDGSFDEKRDYWKGFTTTSRILALGILELMNAITGRVHYSLSIRNDKPSVIQIAINKTEERKKRRDRIKKIEKKSYKGYLYDIEVNSPKHKFYMGIGNIHAHNSQDVTGTSKVILKQVSNWVQGYQREVNEVKRVLDQLNIPKKLKPKPEDIATLKLGQFYVATSDFCKKVYLQPAWMNDKTAIKIAKGELDVKDIEQPVHIAPYQIVAKEQELPSTGTTNKEVELLPKKINELRDDFISNRNDFFTKFSQINETISKIYTEIYTIRNQPVQTINEDEVVMRVLQKMPVTNLSQPSNASVTNLDKEAIIREVLSRVPSGGEKVYTVAPLEKIKKDFLIEAKNMVLDIIGKLDAEQKKILKFIETQNKGCNQSLIIDKCLFQSASSGGTRAKVSKETTEMNNLQVIKKDKNAVCYPNLKDFIRAYLGIHEASEQEIENLYNHIIMEILK